MSEKYWTEVFNRKLDEILEINNKIIELHNKSSKEINDLYIKINKLEESLSKNSNDLKELEKSIITPDTYYYLNNIPEHEFLSLINGRIFDSDLVGRTVRLTENNGTHDWKIIRVNPNSYDLWYNASLGASRFQPPYTYSSTLWDNQNWSLEYYAGILSTNIQNKLMKGLNVNCGDSLVVILSAKQLGHIPISLEYDTIKNDNNEIIPYFNSAEKRNIGIRY